MAPGTSGVIVMTSSPLTTDEEAGPAPGIVCAMTPTLLRKSRPCNCDLPTANSAIESGQNSGCRVVLYGLGFRSRV